MKFTHLLLISPNANSNKFYIMKEQAGDTFTVEFGRVGVSPQKVSYSMRQWNSKYNEKVKKGYKDVTELMSEVKSNDAKLTDNESINSLLMKLLNASKSAFNSTYRVSASSITQMQVDAVQEVINKIVDVTKGETEAGLTHSLFVELWHILPRSMSNVRDYLPKSMEQVKKQLEFEQDSIDNANVQKAFTSTDSEDSDLLKNLGVEISPKLTIIPDDLKEFLGSKVKQVNGIYRLSKPDLNVRFEQFVQNASDKTVAMRYHGTKWKNGMAILSTGLRILGSKSITYSGSMLGSALYTSKDFDKSRNYSDGVVFVLNVHVGKPFMVKDNKDVRHYTYEELCQLGYHSVNADPGVYTGWVTLQRHEQTIYHEHQQTFLYLLDVI